MSRRWLVHSSLVMATGRKADDASTTAVHPVHASIGTARCCSLGTQDTRSPLVFVTTTTQASIVVIDCISCQAEGLMCEPPLRRQDRSRATSRAAARRSLKSTCRYDLCVIWCMGTIDHLSQQACYTDRLAIVPPAQTFSFLLLHLAFVAIDRLMPSGRGDRDAGHV